MSGISEAEKRQYFSMFTQLGPINGYLTGAQAHKWLVNSNIPVNKLEKIWDLCDIDKDGNLDFDEFSVTYRLVNDLLAGVYPDVPPALPAHLIPQSKIHLFSRGNIIQGGGNFIGGGGGNFISGGGSSSGGGGGGGGYSAGIGLMSQQQQQQQQQRQQQQYSQVPPPVPPSPSQLQYSQIPPPVPPPPTLQRHQLGNFPTAPLTDDFDWYMPPADKFNYENQYSSHVGPHGYVRFAFFDDLYETLGIPREECIEAWSLVDVNFEQKLGKDACLVFLHILNERSKGKRIPNVLPKALQTSLVRGKLNYNYNETLDPTSTTRRATSSNKGSPRSIHRGGGTNREEEQLLRELAELNEKLQRAEEKALSTYTTALTSSNSSAVKTEFRQLYEYKQKQLSALKDISGKSKSSLLEEHIKKERAAIHELEDNIQTLKTQMSILDTYLSDSERELRQLQGDIDYAKSVR
ncbi:hypothetical protein G9A89_023585 [Geosiphon pyriformis]|nr:hypothetical protein G9A89_023585 [Geosiphon pyriformis]